MSQMENDIKRFFWRIVYSASLGLVWLIFTFAVGTYNGWLIPEGKLRTANYVFYSFVLITLIALIWILRKFWKEKFPHG